MPSGDYNSSMHGYLHGKIHRGGGLEVAAAERYNQSLDNVTIADVQEGKRNDILNQRTVVNASAC
jgi:hypothetical protein